MAVNLTDDILARLGEAPDAPALSRQLEGTWQPVTIGEFHTEVTSVAKGLLAQGVRPGDRVALLARTSYEWTVVDYAIWWVGAITVPMYDTSSAEQVAWILDDADVSWAVVENARLAERLGGRSLTRWVLADGALGTLREAGVSVDDARLESTRAAVDSTTVATIIYTSGTTGYPKGCVLTHGNFRAEIDGANEVLDALFSSPDASTMVFLPLAHVFARIIQIGALRSGTVLAHSAEVTELPRHLAEVQPTFVIAVPRFFERIFNTASQQAWVLGRGKTFDRAAETAIAYSKALDRGRVGPILKARHATYRKSVYDRVLKALGGRVVYAVSGGAPLGERLAHFYRGIGVTVLEGYGLTETTAAVTVNPPDDVRIGTVGRPLPGVELRADENGELLVRGAQIFTGYWGQPEATAQVLDDDGWFRTGDQADIDADGYVRITGRRKEIIVTSGGKNVSPAILEERVRSHPYVSQCIVVGDKRPFVGALITIDTEQYTGGLDSYELQVAVQQAVDDANTAVSQAESIRKFAILAQDFTERNGYLTPSFKLKRNRVLADFHDTIESLYAR